jgi:DNA-binding NarL/FixJ family response regulator
MSVRILIADDNERVRRGIKELLASETTWQICGEAKNGTEAVQKSLELRPNFILMDISMPELNGLEAARLIRRDLPGVTILVMSQHDPMQLLPRAIEAGANACIDKSRIDVELLPAIKSVEGFTGQASAGRNSAGQPNQQVG